MDDRTTTGASNATDDFATQAGAGRQGLVGELRERASAMEYYRHAGGAAGQEGGVPDGASSGQDGGPDEPASPDGGGRR